MSNFKFIGGILLIIGTTIGAGMLALPLACAEAGFIYSSFFLILCWLIMTSGSLLILEVNLALPSGSNLISMAKQTLGIPGALVTWIINLCLLYTLLAAYIAGINDIINYLLIKAYIQLPYFIIVILCTSIFAFLVYSGMKTVDYLNRVLMLTKLSIYLLCILVMIPFIRTSNLIGGNPPAMYSNLTILITSFGFGTIIPSLRYYFESDSKLLKKAILIGSFIPLICYILWNAVVMGLIPRYGDNGLIAIANKGQTTSHLSQALTYIVNNSLVIGCFNLFSTICMATALLVVSKGLFDFLADGLNLNKKGYGGLWILLITYVPPMLLVIFHPGIFLYALSYAGICCITLLLLLPVLMAWKARKLFSNYIFIIPGNNIILSFLFVSSLIFIFSAFIYIK